MWPVSSQDVDETTQPGRDGSQPGPITAHRRDLHGNPTLQVEVDDLRCGVEQMGALAQIRAWAGKTVDPNRLLHPACCSTPGAVLILCSRTLRCRKAGGIGLTQRGRADGTRRKLLPDR